MLLLVNRQETGFFFIGKQARKGFCYYSNTVDANFCDMLIGLQWDTVIIGKQARNRFCYYWNTVDANVWDMLIGLLWDTVIIGKQARNGILLLAKIGKKQDTVIIGIRWMLMFMIC